MNFEPITQSIVEQLATGFTNSSLPFTAYRMPNSVADYNTAANAIIINPACFVVYSGSSAQLPNNTGPVSQLRKATFNVECHGKSLYGNHGLHALADLVELLLVGFEPLNCNRLYLIKDEISKTEDGIMIHLFQFECETMLVQWYSNEQIIGGQLSQVKNI